MSIKYRANDNNLPLSPLPNGYKVKTLFLRFVEEQSGRQLLSIELSLAECLSCALAMHAANTFKQPIM